MTSPDRAYAQAVKADDMFELYDLKVEVICPPNEQILCGANDGDYFVLEGEMLKLPPGQGISIYSLGAVLPLLAAKQRITHPNDWMTTDAEIACPDPHCKSRMRITRMQKRVFSHSTVTVVPLARGDPSKGEHDRAHDDAIEPFVKDSKCSDTTH
ncbi:hypothetical protein BDM02DRAFT_614422 [Thelephora ganbajun]|uniref:Uncharacterized protein n=1 Tax=Thelephora ganbajun TaxID=370292 RepID=A0ACB6ZQB4_THEGA|nr:hypothetical protein BDM02DRAFT_614422 [Thelephora ganbajun]